jgi:hypothetical protein
MDCAPLKYVDSCEGVAERPSWDSISATSAALTWPSSSRSMTLNDSRMLCRRGGGSLERASLEAMRRMAGGRAASRPGEGSRERAGERGTGDGAGERRANRSTWASTGLSTGLSTTTFSTGLTGSTGGDCLRKESGAGVSSLAAPSNMAAMEAVLRGRAVLCVVGPALRVGETLRPGEAGGSGVPEVVRVCSHGGGVCDDPLGAAGRRFACEGVVGVSLGLSGELFGVEGRRVEGDASLMEPGRRKGDWRGLLKDSGEGL